MGIYIFITIASAVVSVVSGNKAREIRNNQNKKEIKERDEIRNNQNKKEIKERDEKEFRKRVIIAILGGLFAIAAALIGLLKS
ncbi:MAG: hypothetical protein KME54_18750 [Tolypothrix brevis GSE-NOS-MK-07-07A]|jgi:hypothetical protein|nr:hypothetical protein [Tolypothrix brevis GSE-NOS-MK-07-07A]